MKKRILSILLAICLTFTLLPTYVFAAENTYNYLDGTAGANDKEGPAKLIDGDTGTKWCVTSFKSAKIIFETTSAINVSGYSITTGNDNASNPGRNPKSWVLSGCNDYSKSTGDGTWEPIHSVTEDEVLVDKNYTKYSYVFDKTEAAYKYFKLEISAIQSGTVMQMSEFELTDCNHVWTTSTTNPTCTEGGSTRTSCTVCNGVKEVSKNNEPLGHDFGEDGICTRCGQHYCTFDISQGNVRIFDDENNPGKIKVLYGNRETLLNIDPETVITVTGSTKQYELKVETDTPVTIKASDLSIDSSARQYSYAMVLIGSNNSADVTLILEGENTFIGGYHRTGIAAGEGKKLTIEGDGSLTATGAFGAAGIGGEVNCPCGTIIINSGTVTATGGNNAAGIGGGGKNGQSTGGAGGTVIITGGTVNATGNNGADIGGGVDNNTGTVIITGGTVNATNKTGNAGIKPTDNGALEAYGEFTIPVDLTIPEGTLTVPAGVTMTIPAGVALTNDGTIINNGTINNNGAIYVNGSFEGTADNLYYPLTVTNATASGDTAEYKGTTFAKVGSNISLSYTAPEGYYFTGWNVSSSLISVENDIFTMPAEPLTVTAQFKYANYTVKFNTVGGSTIEDKTNVKWSDTVLDGVANPTKTGYSFVGWKCGDKLVTATTTCGELASTDDITEIVLVARWTDNSLFVTKENLMTVFTPNSEGIPESIGKLVFGKNSNKAAQEWYILGKDSGVTGDNTIIFAASPLATNQKFALSRDHLRDTELWFDCVYTGTTPFIVSSNHYGASELRKALKAMAVDSSYFTSAEQNLMNYTSVKTLDTNNYPSVTEIYTTTDKLYALQGEYESQKLLAGSDDGTALAMSSYWSDGDHFWLRTPNGLSAMKVFPGDVVYTTLVIDTSAVQPAANLNLTNVLFASAATAAYDAVSSGSITAGTAMTLRLDGSDKAIGTVMYDTVDGLILAEKSPNAEGTVSLVVQGNNGTDNFYYSLPVDGTAAVSAEQIKTALGISEFSLADCEIWLETTIDNLSYAKTAEAKDIEIISSVEITGVKPFAGEELKTTAVCTTPGIATTAPAITYTANGAEVTGTAEWNKTYKAEVTLEVIATGDTFYMFGDTVSVTVDGEVLTSSVAPNSDGSLTVTKEFDTGNRKLVSVTAPTAPSTFENYYGFEGYDEILTNGGNKELGKLATVTFNGTSEPTTANMNVKWTVESSNGVYNNKPYAKNTFRWTIPAAELANYDATECAEYDAATGTITGTVEITNKAATPVTITGTDTTVYYTGAEIDVSQYFEIDKNAGAATYSIIGGNGVGTLNGTMLTVNEAGAFAIKVDTAANGIYSKGAAVAVLTVKYDLNREYDFDGNSTADILDLVRLKKIIAGVAQSEGADPDLDGSGKADAADLTIFKKFLFGNINVKSAIKLRAAVERLIADPAGGRITFDNDIDLGAEGLEFYNSNSETPSGEITLDLNRHMLSGTDTTTYGKNALILSVNQTALNIENGALKLMYTEVTNPNKYAIFNVNGILRLKNCTVNSDDSAVDSAAVFAAQSSVELENCDLFGGLDSGDGDLITVYANGATITATGNVSVENYFLCRDYNNTPWSLTLKAGGEYSFNGENVSVTEDTTYSSGTETLPNWFYQSIF